MPAIEIETVLAAMRCYLPVLLAPHPASCCIFASRCVIDVFEHFHIPARAVGAIAECFNRQHMAAYEVGLTVPEPDNPNRPEWDRLTGSASASIGGFVGPPSWGTYATHVVVVADDSYLIDGSLGQGRKPGLELLPNCLTGRLGDGRRWLAGETSERFDLSWGGVVIYQAYPQEHGWEDSADWQERSSERKAIVKSLIEGVSESTGTRKRFGLGS